MLKIRAHHLLCTENFVGEGYSDEFSKNMTRVLKDSWEDIKKLACDIIFSKNRREEICGECQWNELCKDVEAKRR